MLPTLDNAQQPIHSLHSVARILGVIRVLAIERQPNYLELGLKIKMEGLSTDLLPTGGEVTLDFRQLALIYQPTSGTATPIPLEGQSQIQLLEIVLKTIHVNELSAIVPYSGGSYTDAMFRAAEGLVNHLKPRHEHVSDSAPLHFETQPAHEYADTLYRMSTSVAHFRTRLNGSMTPIVVWPEHFDLSFLWFSAEPDEHHPHLNFGFAPFSTGIDQPYLYAYAYPYPAQYQTPKLPAGAHWNTEGWVGVMLPYTEIARQNDPDAYVEASGMAIFKALRPLLG